MAYSEKVIDHYENPRNVGSFDKGDDSGGHRHGGRARLRRRDEAADQGQPGHGRDRRRALQDLRLRLGHRLQSLVTEWVKGKTLDEAAALKNSQIAEELALPPVKIHCSILAEDAIKAAVDDYKKKHAH
jgi:nitrogen fixation NifU-like protein